MPVEYDWRLVALSVLIAVQGSYVSLFLARSLVEQDAVRRKLVLVFSALCLGIGIWSMHFIGMLAFDLPVVVTYDVLWTLVSALVCVLVVGLGVFAASYRPLTLPRLAVAGVLMGTGIAAMHYIGMAAMQANCITLYSAPLVLASVGVGIAAATGALWLSFAPRQRAPNLLGGGMMGLAISGMHYTAMAAVDFLPGGPPVSVTAPAFSPGLLAIVVAVMAFLVTGLFVLVLLPDQSVAAPEVTEGDDRRFMPTAGQEKPDQGERPWGLRAEAASDGIPVKSQGQVVLLPRDRIYAVQADAHYTRVFDGARTYFCDKSISELEQRLGDAGAFLRVHRSHIVNLAHAVAFRRVRDQGELSLDGEQAYHVPVSRRRIHDVRTALGL